MIVKFQINIVDPLERNNREVQQDLPKPSDKFEDTLSFLIRYDVNKNKNVVEKSAGKSDEQDLLLERIWSAVEDDATRYTEQQEDVEIVYSQGMKLYNKN